VIAEPSWSSLVVPSQAEESEIMEQLLGTFPSNGEEDHQEFPWPIQASNSFYFHCNASASTYSSTSSNGSGSLSLIMPSEHGSCYLSDSCAAPLHLNMVQDQGAALFMDSILNPAYGSCDSSCDDLEDSSMNLLDTIGTSDKRKHLEQGKLDGHTRVSIFCNYFTTKMHKHCFFEMSPKCNVDADLMIFTKSRVGNMQRSLILRGPRWPCNRKMDKA